MDFYFNRVRTQTLGSKGKRTWFEYQGNVKQGTTLSFSGKPFISPKLYNAALRSFSNQTIKGGFSMTDPIPGGFGEWIRDNSSKYSRRLTPRHGLFISAILVNEGYIRSSLIGNLIILHFPEYNESC